MAIYFSTHHSLTASHDQLLSWDSNQASGVGSREEYEVHYSVQSVSVTQMLKELTLKVLLLSFSKPVQPERSHCALAGQAPIFPTDNSFQLGLLSLSGSLEHCISAFRYIWKKILLMIVLQATPMSHISSCHWCVLYSQWF